jgi:hypothetical protein
VSTRSIIEYTDENKIATRVVESIRKKLWKACIKHLLTKSTATVMLESIKSTSMKNWFLSAMVSPAGSKMKKDPIPKVHREYLLEICAQMSIQHDASRVLQDLMEVTAVQKSMRSGCTIAEKPKAEKMTHTAFKKWGGNVHINSRKCNSAPVKSGNKQQGKKPPEEQKEVTQKEVTQAQWTSPSAENYLGVDLGNVNLHVAAGL